jgi:HD superfamily phosphodiesterase
MELFNNIANDEYIKNVYNKVTEYENLNGIWAKHDYVHVMNVANMVGTVLKQLKYDDNLIEEAMIACILHDIGCIEGKEDHEKRSYDMAKKYLEDRNIVLKNHYKVLQAILDHRDGFDTDNIITLSLIFADKIDIKKDRLRNCWI